MWKGSDFRSKLVTMVVYKQNLRHMQPCSIKPTDYYLWLFQRFKKNVFKAFLKFLRPLYTEYTRIFESVGKKNNISG